MAVAVDRGGGELEELEELKELEEKQILLLLNHFNDSSTFLIPGLSI